jgi:hypothetical protein
MWAHMGEDPPKVKQARPDVPDAFEEVVERGMAKKPEDRYPSTGDLGRAALAAAQDRQATRRHRRRPARRLRSRSGSRPVRRPRPGRAARRTAPR